MLVLILLLAALVCFILAACGASWPRLNFIAAGLACWVGSELVGHIHLG